VLLGGILLGSWGLWAILTHRQPEEGTHPANPGLSSLLGNAAETKQTKAWIEQATQGDPVALARLEERSASARSANEWTAIAAGKAHLRQWSAAVVAYEQALTQNPRLAGNDRVRFDLYQAALDAQASSAALDTVVKHLGASGADLIYAVFEAGNSNRTSKADRRRARALLDSEGLKAKTSIALRIALKVDEARGCSEYKSLLTEVETHGDQRSYRAMRKLLNDRGCGLLGLLDCYPCLRGTRALHQALEAAKARPSPTFGEPVSEPSPRNVSR
jgi:uncharacterized protein YciW